MSIELFSVVTFSQPFTKDAPNPERHPREVIEAYLYSHTKLVEERTVRGDHHLVTTAVLKTSVEPFGTYESKSGGDPDDSRARYEAEYLRQYQLDRLASGMIFGRTTESYDEAHDVVVTSEEKSFY